MGVAGRIVDWLRSDGHDVVHLRDEELHRLPNGEIFRKAAVEKRIVLKGAIVIVEDGRHRMRRLPLGLECGVSLKASRRAAVTRIAVATR